ncbi:zinc ABC transporter substrate-binding protein [Virgisporangium aliadipatigenens]|uniref:Zinc ABC transporter substrate-binding protein n=1 Tax=Virgisporangium aliadipatigenens TaxID=741659 RepID=A0A8J3YN44_9ACTN|nr:metal ABC transporter substrate-binding protein [Virgisporangium aliadipatigenens]GIJ47103.1 zinc ABC transporter substrate-binding protein [Virgisporangium aliadipatigenens]
MRNKLVACAAAFTLLVSGCADDPSGAEDGKLSVVAAFYPLRYLAERIGGDTVRVTDLAKPGVEPHDLELEPKQVATVGAADLVVYLAGFMPAVDDVIADEAKGKAFDVAGVEPLADAPPGAEEEEESGEKHANEGKDPHVWLDPTRFAAIGDKLAERLATADPDHAEAYKARAAEVRGQLTALDGEYTKALATCQRREIVTSHAAFGYLAARYRLTQVPISGLSPEGEPSPQHVAEVATMAREKGVTTIFFETLVSPKIAETLAKEVGAKAEVLDPLEGIEAGSNADYLSVMRQNLGKLTAALSCS